MEHGGSWGLPKGGPSASSVGMERRLQQEEVARLWKDSSSP